MLVTCDGGQGSGVGVGQRHISFVWLRQVGVTAELLFLGQLEGDRDHTKLSSRSTSITSTPLHSLLFLPPLSSRALPPTRARSHPFAVQRACPFSFLRDEDHAAPLLLLLTLSQLDLGVTHRHHHLLRCACAHAPARALKGPGGRRLGGEVPGEGVSSK